MLVDFKYLFLYEFFELEIWRKCYQHRDNPLKKIHGKTKNFNPWEGLKVGNSENYYCLLQQHRFRIFFWSKSFELEIWHTYYQHRADLMEKNSWKKENSILEKVAKLAIVKVHSYTCW